MSLPLWLVATQRESSHEAWLPIPGNLSFRLETNYVRYITGLNANLQLINVNPDDIGVIWQGHPTLWQTPHPTSLAVTFDMNSKRIVIGNHCVQLRRVLVLDHAPELGYPLGNSAYPLDS